MKQLVTEYKILSSDCDRYGFFKMNRILVLMQELAGEHSELLGCSFADTLKLGAVWVVTRNEFVVDRYPVIAQTVIGSTFPGRVRRGIYTRYYSIKDREGRSLIRGSSFWALADVNTRQMVDIPEIAAHMPDNSDLPPPFHLPGAPEELAEGFSREALWQPVYTDLDRNGHVNNTRAADWGLCFLSEAADLRQHPVRSLLASYHREMTQKDEVALRFNAKDKAFSLRCEVRGEVALRLSGELAEEAMQPGEEVPF